MLRRLRWQLTAVYLLAGVVVIALIGGGSYTLLDRYFQDTTDLSLQRRMATELRRFGVVLPPELLEAERKWCELHNYPTPMVFNPEQNSGDSEDHPGETSEHIYDTEAAAIFVLPLNEEGQLLFDPNAVRAPFSPDADAVQAAQAAGCDWRVIRLEDGTRVRLFTYQLPPPVAPALLQLGLSLADQDRVLRQLLMGIGFLGGISILLVGSGSWWLAGRALYPAERAWKQQQEFIANASHELRTPLTLIRASAEVAQRGKPGGRQEELVTDILQESDHMSHLVEDLLLLSRLDSNRLELERQVIPLAELLTDLQRQMERVAQQHDVLLKLETVEGKVMGDPTRLRQVLLILLDNALRHTPSGREIRLKAEPHRDVVRISVADTGGGIPEEHQRHVFERFYQVDKSRTGEGHGSGLGLSIAKALVEAQGGRISLESAEGKGTVVTLELPAV